MVAPVVLGPSFAIRVIVTLYAFEAAAPFHTAPEPL